VFYDRPLNCRYLTVRERSQEERRGEGGGGRRGEPRRFIYAMLIYGTECSAFAVISHIVGLLFHFIFYRDLNARVQRVRGGGLPRSFVILSYLVRNYAMDLQDRPFVRPGRDMQTTRDTTIPTTIPERIIVDGRIYGGRQFPRKDRGLPLGRRERGKKKKRSRAD